MPGALVRAPQLFQGQLSLGKGLERLVEQMQRLLGDPPLLGGKLVPVLLRRRLPHVRDRLRDVVREVLLEQRPDLLLERGLLQRRRRRVS